MTMSLPFVSLDSAGAIGPGAVRDLERSVRAHTVIVSATGEPSSASVRIEGSHDNTIWVALASVTFSGSSAEASTASTHHVRYVRANLTALSGGSSPSVSATIASGDE